MFFFQNFSSMLNLCAQIWLVFSLLAAMKMPEFAIDTSLRGRRLKGKGEGVLRKGVLGARETRGAREGGVRRHPSRFSRAQNSLSQNSLSFPFQTPATQATSTPELSKLILTAKRLRNLEGNKIKRDKSWVTFARYLSCKTNLLWEYYICVLVYHAHDCSYCLKPLLHVPRFSGVL